MEPIDSIILVADDDQRILNLFKSILTDRGHRVITATNGAEVLELVKAGKPDLFLLDVMMPDPDGIELCRRLKQDPECCDIPVIFVTAKDDASDVVRGFEAGAADYLRKPINKLELLARVGTHLRLYHGMRELERLGRLALDSNPSTGLPGNNSIAEAISGSLEQGANDCVIYCDLDNFKAFNDRYGFAAGDEVIKFTAGVINQAAAGAGRGFVGHIGGDDFILVIDSSQAAAVAERIIKEFDRGVREFYDEPDLVRGGIISVDRQGIERKFPIMSISLAAVDLSQRRFSHYLEVSDECAALKKCAKNTDQSCIVFDRRSDPAPESQAPSYFAERRKK